MSTYFNQILIVLCKYYSWYYVLSPPSPPRPPSPLPIIKSEHWYSFGPKLQQRGYLSLKLMRLWAAQVKLELDTGPYLIL